MRWHRKGEIVENGPGTAAGRMDLGVEGGPRDAARAQPTAFRKRRALGALAVGAGAFGSIALGAAAIGAIAIGAFAIGRLSVGGMRVGTADVAKLRIGRLEVEEWVSPHARRGRTQSRWARETR